jgi:RimJ/RimL family protein N-acetyltransferase
MLTALALPAVTFRLAELPDVDALVAMAVRFQDEVYVRHLFATPETFRTLATSLLQSPNAEIFLACRDDEPVGMLAATLITQPMSGALWGAEICWWMEPTARDGRTAFKMLRLAEEWARGRGAVMWCMSAPNPAVCRLYDALHYGYLETLYGKRL